MASARCAGTGPGAAAAVGDVAVLLVGLVVGGALGWLTARLRLEASSAFERTTRAGRVGSLETLADELRKQLTQVQIEAADFRVSAESERAARMQAETRLESARQALDEQRALLESARQQLGETFKALSADALRQNQLSFLALAEERLGHRQEAIDGVVAPLREALQRVEAHTHQLESRRERAYGTLEEHLRTLRSTNDDLRRETSNLVTALRGSQVRGRWGELTLHRVVELAGLAEHCDFSEQVTLRSEAGTLRPDMVVHLPGDRDIVVDAKVPLSAYLEALDVARPEDRSLALARHAAQMRQHMTILGGKAYWEQFSTALDVVVMFVPGEGFLAAAVHEDPALLEDGMARRVVIATPTTLITLLRGVAYGWKQERLAANAAAIRDLGRDLYERLRTLAGHFERIGGALGQSVKTYNEAIGSLESRVLPKAREFRELGAGEGEEIRKVRGVEQMPRPLTAPELTDQLTLGE